MENDVFKELPEELKSKIRSNQSIKKIISMRVGGTCRYFCEIEKLEDLKTLIRFCFKENIPYIVLGNGTNIIFSDDTFDGIIIKNSCSGLIFESSEAVAESGISLGTLIRKLAEGNMGGLEFLAGIPGTLGGAIYGNAGAYGKTMADVVCGVTLLDTDGKEIQISNQNMQFGYRSSYLKKIAQKHDRWKMPVILTARLKIIPKTKEGVLRVVDNYIKIRSKKYSPQLSSGSFYKNIFLEKYPHLKQNGNVIVVDGKVPAGFLIDQSGLKGEKVGGAEVSREHANFLVNSGGASAKDLYDLSRIVEEKVKKNFEVNLEKEVEFVGDFKIKPKSFFEKIFRK